MTLIIDKINLLLPSKISFALYSQNKELVLYIKLEQLIKDMLLLLTHNVQNCFRFFMRLKKKINHAVH